MGRRRLTGDAAFSLWDGEGTIELSENVAWALDALVVEVVEVGVGVADAAVEAGASALALVVLGHGSAAVLITLGISVGPGLSGGVRVGNCVSLSLCNRVGNGLRKDSSDGGKEYEFHCSKRKHLIRNF